MVSARGDRPALEAFLELDNHGLSGVAVVTRDGTIAGNTSAQDLRYFLVLEEEKRVVCRICRRFVYLFSMTAVTAL